MRSYSLVYCKSIFQVGIRQLYALGLHLRQVYGSFIHNNYIPSEVTAFRLLNIRNVLNI